MRQIVLRGNYFENGQQIGKIGAKSIHQLLKRDKKLLASAQKKQKALISFLLRKLTREFPEYIDELRGMTNGARVGFIDLFLENCAEVLSKEDGCTSAAFVGKNQRFIIHNEDEDKWRTANNCAILHYKKGGHTYSSFDYFGELAGNAFNWNSGGLFSCVDLLPSLKNNLQGIPRYFAARALLEKKTADETIDFLRSVDCASGFHYLLGDKDKTVSVEQLHKNISVMEISDFYSHANHYIHPRFSKLFSKKDSDSARRLKITMQNKISGSENALRLWRTKLKRPFNKKDERRTFATVLADFSKPKLAVDILT